MFDASRYTITVRKGEFDGETCFEARIRELPDAAEYADTYEEAYALALDTLQTTHDVLAAQGHAMPAPFIPADDFSGRVTLRLPKTLHRYLAITAEDEDVSLNQHIVDVLSRSVGWAASGNLDSSWQQSPKTPPGNAKSPAPHLRVVSHKPINMELKAA